MFNKNFIIFIAILSIIGGVNACPPKNKLYQVDCGICTYVTSLLENYIVSNATEGHLENIIERVCVDLPQKFQQRCPSLMKEYIPDIIQLVESYLSPIALCTDLKFCPSNRFFRRAIYPYSFSSARKTSSDCATCEAAVASMENEALDFLNSTKWDNMVRFCQDLPERRVQLCFDILSIIPIVINGFVAKYPPETLCSDILICRGKLT